MVVLFLLSLPGLVVIVIGLGVYQLIRARVKGTKRPGAGSAGINLLDTVLKPGSEHLINEKESRQFRRDENDEAAPPFDHTTNTIRIKRKGNQ